MRLANGDGSNNDVKAGGNSAGSGNDVGTGDNSIGNGDNSAGNVGNVASGNSGASNNTLASPTTSNSGKFKGRRKPCYCYPLDLTFHRQ